jgi:hypothetical protein
MKLCTLICCVSARTHAAASVKTKSTTIPPDIDKIKEYLRFMAYTENRAMPAAAESALRNADIRCIREGKGEKPATMRNTPEPAMHFSPSLGDRG